MNDVLAGVKVVEVAAWTFVPAAGAVLAEWGADVIKVEPKEGGDPQRGLVTMGLVPAGKGGVNYMIEMPNRGKKSIGIDLATEGGKEVLYKLVEGADVFVTNYLPKVRKKLGIDLDDIRKINPNVIYVRGSAYGPNGPGADKPGYDGVSYWSRGGVGHQLTLSVPNAESIVSPRPAFGDVMGGMTIAGGIVAALFKKERTGKPSVVDVSLLGLAAWNLSPDITSSKLYESSPIPNFDRKSAPNPLVGNYKTKDDRFVTLMMLQGDKFYAEFCTVIGRPDLITDERYADPMNRFNNRVELIATLDEEFAKKTLAEWTEILENLSGAWGPVQSAYELHEDPDVIANGYIPEITSMAGAKFAMPVNPVQFDEQHVVPPGAPEHGQHTEELLLEAGVAWEDIEKYKEQGAIL
ncbi:MAG TPA: CoA transferase [Mycobacteriales bacterium]|nr:CoA transferase [Mycobacteriales bacterium]